MTKIIHVASAFAKSPGGRYRSDGPFSGERFREEYLVPAFSSHEFVEVSLAGTLGLGSSFLDEAFGGLVRECGFTPAELHRRLKIESPLATYKQRVWRYVDEARAVE
jgi:hypothetical protein